MIKPTIGRKVWYWPTKDLFGNLGGQPFDATIVYVHDDCCVNLAIRDHYGIPLTRSLVVLLQGDDAREANPAGYATWMPYQGRAGEGGVVNAHLNQVLPLAQQPPTVTKTTAGTAVWPCPQYLPGPTPYPYTPVDYPTLPAYVPPAPPPVYIQPAWDVGFTFDDEPYPCDACRRGGVCMCVRQPMFAGFEASEFVGMTFTSTGASIVALS